MGMSRVKLGACFQIPLRGNRYACCQYVASDEKYGDLVRVFRKICDEPITSPSDVAGSGEAFPPVFVGLRATIKSGRWQRIGNLRVDNFKFPEFRSSFGTLPGVYTDWWIRDRDQSRFVGPLPPELRKLELDQVWGDELLEERIATGVNPFEGIQ